MSESVYARYENYSLGETFTKEQILNIISQAIENGTVQNVDWGAVSILKEINKNQPLRFWVGTSAEYEVIEHKENNVLYIRTDDTSAAEINAAIAALQQQDVSLEGFTRSVLDVALRSWQYLNNQRTAITFPSDESGFYYLNSQGNKMTGAQYIERMPYLFASNGVLKTGWQTVFGKRYYYSPIDGNIVIGWIDDTETGHKFYVSLKDGKYASGYYLIDGKFYQFDEHGYATEFSISTHGIIEFDAEDIGVTDLDGIYTSAVIYVNGHTEMIFSNETINIQTGETDTRNVTLRNKVILSPDAEHLREISEIIVSVGSESGQIKYTAFK